MAGTTLLALIDDIATILDDVATMTKVAAKKTAGVLGDDLALNAQQVTGVRAERELPVVWAVAKGSLINKAILVPAALLISWLLPGLITPLLMIGGAFLCYEGCEKLAHKWLHSAAEDAAARQKILQALADPAVDLVALERDKIKGAVRTDFILSAEIVVITLGAVAGAPLAQRVGVLVGMSLLMTVGVYGLVAGIVKLDDLGLLRAAPWLMKTLSVVGTAAMFMVGGGILLHGWPALAHAVEAWAAGWGSLLAVVINTAAGAAVGVVAGALVLAGVMGVQRWRR
ncbi:MAG: DUF808 domain-containing protein [Hylemonella sp.]|uniref:DUF808 domain-containing protein n=1 Tax=Hylemonella sp. TaxID=2066020 RepID=UPI00391A5B98